MSLFRTCSNFWVQNCTKAILNVKAWHTQVASLLELSIVVGSSYRILEISLCVNAFMFDTVYAKLKGASVKEKERRSQGRRNRIRKLCIPPSAFQEFDRLNIGNVKGVKKVMITVFIDDLRIWVSDDSSQQNREIRFDHKIQGEYFALD